jgi:8-amino-7-oxononanoate synthase
VDALAALIHSTPCVGTRFVVVESVYSMEGTRAPLARLADLCRATGAALVVDEAHAVGIYGEQGSGLIEEEAVADAVFVSVNPAGKALGVGGALIAGAEWAVEYLVQRARPFIFSTAAPPALAAALLTSLDIVGNEPSRRSRLRILAGHLRGGLRAGGLDVSDDGSHIVPIRIGSNEAALAVSGSLLAAGFDVRAIRPPTVPPGTARLRVSVNIGVNEETLDRFVAETVRALKEAGVCSAVSS